LGGAKYRQILSPPVIPPANKKEMKTMLVNTHNTTVPFDLFEQQPNPNRELPEDLFDCDEVIAMATVAALCTGHARAHGQLLLRQMALFAAGAQVKFNIEDFRDCERTVRTWMSANQPAVDHEVVVWVLREAYNRAKSLGMAGPGRVNTDQNPKLDGFAFIEPEDGRGFGDLAADLADELFVDKQRTLTADEAAYQAQFERYAPLMVAPGPHNWTRKRLVTYAAVFAALKPRLCNHEVEAVVVLALYGAGARISLEAEQFDALRMQVERYIDCMKADRYAKFRNREMAEFALEAARKRAEVEGIVA